MTRGGDFCQLIPKLEKRLHIALSFKVEYDIHR